jgi:DNA polymerase III subunit delta'
LKILEEPPPHTYFILVTNAADKLLPTILSRTQLVTVPLLDFEEVEQYLIAKHNVDHGRAGKVAQVADGNLNLAIKLLDKEEDNNAQQFADWMRACFGKSYNTLVSIADQYHGFDKLRQRSLMAYGMNMFRESLLHVSGANTISKTRGEELEFVQRFSKVMDIEKIEKSFQLLNEASYHLERNGSAKMIFLDVSLKLSKTFKPV